MTLNKLILICFCGLLFIACKRKGTVSGKVTNIFDNKPLEGVGVRITESAELDPSAKALQATTTDANGSFKINATYNTRVTYDYYISLKPYDNYNTADPFVVKDTTSVISKTYLYYTSHYRTLSADIKDVKKTKDNQNFEFNVAPCARLRIIGRNIAPASVGDKIEVSIVDKNLPDGSKNIYTGKDISPAAGNYMMVPTNGTVSIKWKLTSNNVEVTSYDTIPLLPYTKSVHYIDY